MQPKTSKNVKDLLPKPIYKAHIWKQPLEVYAKLFADVLFFGWGIWASKMVLVWYTND